MSLIHSSGRNKMLETRKERVEEIRASTEEFSASLPSQGEARYFWDSASATYKRRTSTKGAINPLLHCQFQRLHLQLSSSHVVTLFVAAKKKKRRGS